MMEAQKLFRKPSEDLRMQERKHAACFLAHCKVPTAREPRMRCFFCRKAASLSKMDNASLRPAISASRRANHARSAHAVLLLQESCFAFKYGQCILEACNLSLAACQSCEIRACGASSARKLLRFQVWTMHP